MSKHKKLSKIGLYVLCEKPTEFNDGQHVFLGVLKDSESLKMGSCVKLVPRYCETYTITKHIWPNAYRFDLPPNVMVHPVFHVSRPKKALVFNDNVVSPLAVTTLKDNHFISHEPRKNP